MVNGEMTGAPQDDVRFLHAWKHDENASIDDLRQHMETMTDRCREEDYRSALGAMSMDNLTILDEMLLACCGQFMSFQEDDMARSKAQEIRNKGIWRQNPDISIIGLLTSVLRTLRNATVHNAPLQNTLHHFCSLDWMGGLLTSNYLLHDAGEAFVEQLRTMRRILVQAMTNIIVNNEDNARKLWEHIFPTAVATGLEVANTNASRDPVLAERLCMLVHSCTSVRNSSQRIDHLVHSRKVLCEILMTAPSYQESDSEETDSNVSEILVWIIESVCEANRLAEAWETLRVNAEDSDPLHRTSKEQLVLLYSVEAVLDERKLGNVSNTRDFVTRCFDSLFSVEALASPSLTETERVWCHLNIKKSQLILRVMAKYCELLEAVAPETGGASSFQDELRDTTTALEFCAGELEVVHRHSVNVGKRDERCTLEIPSGYRSDLMHTIGCIVHKNKGAQDQVLRAGGIPMVLNNCRILASEPLLREWALLAIRNLCEGNQDIQNLIASYKAEDVANPEEAQRMGLEAKVQNGKLTVEAQKPQ